MIFDYIERPAAQPPAIARQPPTVSRPSAYGAPTPYFQGYPCTVDCSGHEAGYEWAEENDIDDPDDCGGNSQSFIEGCQAYGEERMQEAEEEARQDQERLDEEESDVESEDY
jgi:hypothetical protein